MVEGGFYENFLDAYLWDNAIFNGQTLNKLTPEFHRKIYRAAETSRLLAVGCPVRFGKSAVCSFVIPIADCCLQRVKKVLLISNSSDLAETFLANIKQVFENNILLKELGMGKGDIWRSDHIQLPNKVEIVAKGWSSNIRGGGYDLIVLDDPENDEEVESEDRRVKKKDWFSAALFGRLEPNARLMLVGSLIHPLCLVNWVIEDTENRFSDFTKLKFAAWETGIDGKDHSIWKDRWSDEELEFRRRNMTAKAVASELLSEPILAEDMKVRPEWLPVYKTEDVPDQEDLFCVTVIDPATSETQSKKRDYDAIVTIGMETKKKNPNFYVLSTKRGHFSSDDKVAAVVDQRLRFGSRKVILEGIGGFADLAQALKKEGERQNIYLDPLVVKPNTDKGVRLESVLLLFEHGRVFTHQNMYRLRDELIMFPRGDHDDLMDALVHGLMYLNKHHKGEFNKDKKRNISYPTLTPDPVSGRLR